MSIPVALTIAGSDCSAGAGAQADLKTMTALGVYGLTALTCVVAEVPGRVEAIAPVPPEVVAGQVRLCLETFPIAALKTGMLHCRGVVEAVCEVLEAAHSKAHSAALVVDPVMVASSGDALLEPDAAREVRERLLPLALLVTPNLAETASLLGRAVEGIDAMKEAGRALCARYGCAFLIKGGHLAGDAADVLVTPDGGQEVFTAARVPGVSTHGTGCTLSAAITAGLATGLPLREAVARGKAYVTRAIAGSLRWEGGLGKIEALNHAGLPFA